MGRFLQKEITQTDYNNAFQLSYIKCSCLKLRANVHEVTSSLSQHFKVYGNTEYKPTADVHRNLPE